LADVLGFGGSMPAYGVALALGVIVTVVALIGRRVHGVPEIRLSGMDVAGPGDLEEVRLPKETVYLSPASITSLDCRDELLILLRAATVIGIGLTALAFFGLVSNRWFGSHLAGLVASSAVGVAAALLAYARSGQWFFGRSVGALACADVVGVPGEVTVPIPQDSFGTVTATIHGKPMTFSARAANQAAIAHGARVRVVDWAGGRVVVVPAEETEHSVP
jgi:hypothetical protein